MQIKWDGGSIFQLRHPATQSPLQQLFWVCAAKFSPQATSARCGVFCRWKQDADLPAKLCFPSHYFTFFFVDKEGTNSLGSRPRKPRSRLVTVSLGTNGLLKQWLNQPVTVRSCTHRCSHFLCTWKSIFHYLELTFSLERTTDARTYKRMPKYAC